MYSIARLQRVLDPDVAPAREPKISARFDQGDVGEPVRSSVTESSVDPLSTTISS